MLHDSVLKKIAVFANKTLLEILLVGLNIYLTMGEHSIAYSDLKKYIAAEEIEAITSLITSVDTVQIRLLIFCLQKVSGFSLQKVSHYNCLNFKDSFVVK